MDTYFGTAANLSGSAGRLFHDRHELRINYPLIGSHQPEPVDACRCHDDPVTWVAQRIPHRRDLGSNLNIDGHDVEGTAWFERAKYFADRRLQSSTR